MLTSDPFFINFSHRINQTKVKIMNTISQSFAYLVANNNGLFKSEKQAKTLLNYCQDRVFHHSGNFFGTSWSKFYHCDGKGVVMVIHHTNTKGNVLEWERPSEGVKPIQEIKEEKRINREIKAIEKKIVETEEAWQRGDYAGYENLYHETMERDNLLLTAYEKLLG
jgi:hypothetical protein